MSSWMIPFDSLGDCPWIYYTSEFRQDIDPYISVGDIVIFETSELPPKNTPRWVMNDDTGGSGNYAYGRVISLTEEIIQIEYEISGFYGKGHARFPNAQHPDYFPEQWLQEGYLAFAAVEACGCGSAAVYGKKTELHSHWCPRYKQRRFLK